MINLKSIEGHKRILTNLAHLKRYSCCPYFHSNLKEEDVMSFYKLFLNEKVNLEELVFYTNQTSDRVKGVISYGQKLFHKMEPSMKFKICKDVSKFVVEDIRSIQGRFCSL